MEILSHFETIKNLLVKVKSDDTEETARRATQSHADVMSKLDMISRIYCEDKEAMMSQETHRYSNVMEKLESSAQVTREDRDASRKRVVRQHSELLNKMDTIFQCCHGERVLGPNKYLEDLKQVVVEGNDRVNEVLGGLQRRQKVLLSRCNPHTTSFQGLYRGRDQNGIEHVDLSGCGVEADSCMSD